MSSKVSGDYEISFFAKSWEETYWQRLRAASKKKRSEMSM